MAYGRKYYKEFDGYNAATRQSYTVLVDIYEDGFAGSAIEIEEISASPLQLSLDSSGDPLYTAIKKTSATFNIINTNQFDYSEFYTSNAKKYKMMITSPVFNWTGYLVPQAVSFDMATNGEFSLTASDGLHLLQSIDYKANENEMTTLAAFLTDIETKIGLSTFNRTSTVSTEYGDIWNSLIYKGMLVGKTYEEAFEMVLKAIGMQVRYWKITPIISIESALQTASVKCVNDYPELNFLAPIKTAKLTKNITTLPSAFKNALVDDVSDLKPRAANSYYTLTNWTVVSDNGLVVFDIGANETDRKANKYKSINMFVKPTNATYDSQRLTGNEGSYFQLRPVQKTPFTLSFNANFGRISEYGRSSADGYRAYIHPVKWSSIKWGLYDSISNKSYSKTTNSWSITGTPTSATANELKVTDPADSFVDVYIPIPAPTGLTANLRFYLFTGAVEYVNAAPVGESRTNRLSIKSIDIDGEYVVSENELYTAVNGAVAVGDNIDVLDYEVDFGSVPVPPLNTSLYYGSAFFDKNLNQLEDIIIGANTVSHEQYLFNTILYTQNEIRKKVYTANVNMLTNVSPFWLKTTLKTDTVMVNACSFDFKTSQLNGEFTEIMPYVYREWNITSESEIGSSDWGGSGGTTGGSGGGGTVDTSNFVVKIGAVTQNIEGSVTVEGAVVAGATNGVLPDDLPVATGLLYGVVKLDDVTIKLDPVTGKIYSVATGGTSVSWGTEVAGQSIQLNVASVLKTLALSGHTHSQYLTAITKTMVEAVLTGTITSHQHNYLPISGGNLTGPLTILTHTAWHAGNANKTDVDWSVRELIAPTYALHTSPTNPYLKFVLNGLDWYVQMYQDKLYMGYGIGNSLEVDQTGNTKIPGNATVEGLYSSGPVVAGALNGIAPDDLPVATSSLYGVIKFDPTTLALNGSNQLTVVGGGWSNVAWGTATSQYSPLTINSVTRNLSVDGHTHSYLPLSGGNLTGSIAMANNILSLSSSLSDNQTDGAPWYGLRRNPDDSYVKLSGYFGLRLKTSSNQLEIPIAGDLTYNTNTIWHAGNDGAGSGLDADLLRGVAPSSLAVLSATKLANTRTIWGQNFNGEGNVSGSINNVIDIIAETYSIHDSSTNPYLKLALNGLNWYVQAYQDRLYFGYVISNSLNIDSSGNVGIGATSSSSYKLDVNGAIRSTGAAYINSTLSVTGASTLTGLLTANGGISATTGTFSSYLTANRFYTGYDSGSANAISCSNWFRSSGATGWLNATYSAGILSDTANIVRTYNTNKFKVYNTAIDSILTLGGVTAANVISSGAVVAGALNGTLPDDLPIATGSLFGVIKSGVSLFNNAGLININGRHYTTVTTYTDAAVREITAEIALGTGSMANGALDQIQLSFAPLTTTRGLTANVITTSTGAGMGLKLSFRKDTGTGRWYIMIYNDSGAAITRDGILLSIRGQQTI